MNENRLRDLERLNQTRFDVLIIGGGITGACLAWDASMRGLRVALVEQADYGGATSSATSKLIHGGLRYLKNAEIGLVRESLRERRILQKIAPHLVWPIPFLIPTYKTGNQKWMIRAGMVAYDLLSFDRNKGMDREHQMPAHRFLSIDQVCQAEPIVDPTDLTGGAIYYDAGCHPDRLTLEFVLAAHKLGALCLNYTKVTGVGHTNAGYQMEILDRLTQNRYAVESKMVVNVAGPWADEVDQLFGVGDQITLLRSKGIHIITRALTQKHALVLRTKSGGHFFIIPYQGHSLIGTTDTRYEGRLDDLSATDDDVSEFLEDINQACPQVKLSLKDVLYRYAGVRPLVEQDTQVYQASRKYEIVDHHRRGYRGLISAVGGKYTTSRNLAQKLTDRILLHLDRQSVQCLTHRTLLPGGVSTSMTKALEDALEQHKGAVPDSVLTHLVNTYGARYLQVLQMVQKEPELAEQIEPDKPEIMAEIALAIDSEMAQTLTDVLVRRVGLGLFGAPSESVLDRLLDFVSKRLNWSERRCQKERAIFQDKLVGEPERLFAIGPD